MTHTLAIPGLINVHAADQDVHVDQKLEIHDPDEVVFGGEDGRVGRFRSLYVGKRGGGTESTYENLEADKVFYENL
jgi:twinfilin-like protein